MAAPDLLRIHPGVAEALSARQGVVALESTIISHGLPADSSADVARQIEAAVRASGAVPATIALLDGVVRIGLDDQALERVATDPAVVKASIRDLGPVLATGMAGATTVASTAYLAHRVGIDVFATGGLGGVHRGAQESWDESADLAALAQVPITVVCAGVKSILDVPATLERLESLSIGLVGYRTDVFPGFYVRDSGQPVPWRLDDVEAIAETVRQRHALGLQQALVVANPIDESAEMEKVLHDTVVTSGLRALSEAGVRGKDVTPFLLAHFHEQTHGRSLAANIDLVLSNARVAGQIAVAASRTAD
ncbi:MAG TPA: pseudouridine-5'-phosphate glycosidase [Nocardioidaceae bacterium]